MFEKRSLNLKKKKKGRPHISEMAMQLQKKKKRPGAKKIAKLLEQSLILRSKAEQNGQTGWLSKGSPWYRLLNEFIPDCT